MGTYGIQYKWEKTLLTNQSKGAKHRNFKDMVQYFIQKLSIQL